MNLYFHQLKISKKGINEKLTRSELDAIYLLHRKGEMHGQSGASLGKNKYYGRWVKNVPDDFKVQNPFDVTTIVFSDNRFDCRNPHSLKTNGELISTVFSDLEAFSVCLGLEDSYARRIARSFFSGGNSTEEKKDAHIIAMRTLEKYGSTMLTFVLGLPALPFKCADVKKIFSLMDKRMADVMSPVIRINFTNAQGVDEPLHITFYSEISGDYIDRYSNVLAIKNNAGSCLLKVARDGRVVPVKDVHSIIPVLQLFIRFSYDPKQFIINFGLQTGYCSVCGRKLTDPESIRIGIGPKCRNGY